ncbi:MAG: hypothetical protein JW741_06575 [Sedimentisphaerales bacterium]|nr:hypothetical protein [Sedimentisphaerales bacterium]
MRMFDTATLSDAAQRSEPIEHIGMLVGTCGTAPYVHLHLAQAERFFGPGGLPILVVNDGEGEEFGESALRALCEQYGADFQCGPYLGHTTGDLRAFQFGFEWAAENNVQVMAKFSRRFIPLVSWRHELLYLTAKNRHACAFTRRNDDRADGLFRTDCIALRVDKWRNERVREVFGDSLRQDWRRVCVERIMMSLTRVLGGWEWWGLLGEGFSRPHDQALQWRGILPCHYGDLSRFLGLPYGDLDFMAGHFGTAEELLPHEHDIPKTARVLAVHSEGEEP